MPRLFRSSSTSCQLRVDSRTTFDHNLSALAVEVLLDHEDVEVDFQDDHGATPLHHAAVMGHQKVVEKLLQAGADPLLQDSYGRIASDYARGGGHETLADRLDT